MAAQEPFCAALVEKSDVVRDLSEGDVLGWAAFGLLIDWELVKFLERVGWRLVRQSFTFKDDETLMVVKVLVDDIPYVVFTTRRTPIDCMRTFVRKLSSKGLALYPDKYA